eukprot:scaffold806_cov64-Phaeocystis_antarctica.AAC.5
MRLSGMLLLCATLISAHRVSQCTTRASSSPAARRAAVSCQLPAVAAANACVEATANPLLAYEMVQGADVVASSARQHPPTCLLTHGILGSRRNLKSFAQRMALDFPNWQFLLVDLRCHGQSSALSPAGPNTVEAAALDVIVPRPVQNVRSRPQPQPSAAAFSRSRQPDANTSTAAPGCCRNAARRPHPRPRSHLDPQHHPQPRPTRRCSTTSRSTQ